MSFIIAPSILSADFGYLGAELGVLDGTSADWIHLDVMDGDFVPNISFGAPVIRDLRKHSKKTFDVHLMISEPVRYIDDFRIAGADIITVHAEACSDLPATLAAIRKTGAKAGVALKPGTAPDCIPAILDSVDLILAMTVEPGFGGQAFIGNMLSKIREIQEMVGERDVHIEVDGGINPETAALAAQAGANVFVAGSSVFVAGSAAPNCPEHTKYDANIQAIIEKVMAA